MLFGFGGGSSGGLGEFPRNWGVRDRGLLVISGFGGCSFGGLLFGGGDAGNLKLWENEPEGFLFGRAGVFGAVETPDVRFPCLTGSGNEFEGSCIVGGKEAPPIGGE